jgi:hypothetical protein
MTREQLAEIYIEWVNDYCTIEKYAENNGLTLLEAQTLLAIARSCHYNPHPEA